MKKTRTPKPAEKIKARMMHIRLRETERAELEREAERAQPGPVVVHPHEDFFSERKEEVTPTALKGENDESEKKW